LTRTAFTSVPVDEQISHDPDELLAKYRKLMAEVAETQEALKQELVAALERAN